MGVQARHPDENSRNPADGIDRERPLAFRLVVVSSLATPYERLHVRSFSFVATGCRIIRVSLSAKSVSEASSTSCDDASSELRALAFDSFLVDVVQLAELLHAVSKFETRLVLAFDSYQFSIEQYRVVRRPVRQNVVPLRNFQVDFLRHAACFYF